MKTIESLERVARARVERARDQIRHSEECVKEGNPLAAERDPKRLKARIQAKASLSREETDAILVGIEGFSRMTDEERTRVTGARGPEAIYGRTIDFVGISFLERGLSAARAVARVAFLDGRPQGSGVMVADRLFLTNHHVIGSTQAAQEFCLEFDYELDPRDRPRGITKFSLDPSTFFLSDPVNGLDFTLVAVGNRLSGPKQLSDYGWRILSDSPAKHALGEVANIVQHPDGRYKEVVLRENRLVARLDEVLHYVADTEPGSSGSPVFNNEWQMIALHHWGGPWRQQVDDNGRALDREINEGIRVSAIVKNLKSQFERLDAARREMLRHLLDSGERTIPDSPEEHPSKEDRNGSWVQLDADGTARWRVPIEISVRLPGQGGFKSDGPSAPSLSPAVSNSAAVPSGSSEARMRPNNDYAGRSGYKPRFIDGFTVELPQLSERQKIDAAPNLQAQPGDDPFELKYHHFSVVMNRVRRLAFFTACNIDGTRAKHVDRETGQVTSLDPDDPALEGLTYAEGAEASETWYDDERLSPDDYAGREIYERQLVPGFPDTSSMARTLRMFQRGHLVRRMDPAWGTDGQALLADADTFHWTNCSPQVGFFNMGRAGNRPGTGGGKLWRAVENYVLRNSVAERQRVCSFTGPVFARGDREFRGIKVPGRFWKIVVWADNGSLRSLGMIADQRPVIRVWPESLGDGPEAYGDSDELNMVQDFLSTIREIERLTKLDFGDEVRAADIRNGEAVARVVRFDEIQLDRRGARRAARPGRLRPRKTVNQVAVATSRNGREKPRPAVASRRRLEAKQSNREPGKPGAAPPA
jgi:endonuclease G